MPPALPTLTQDDILRWAGEASLAKGQAYFRRGSILHARRQGNRLTASCLGSSAPSYRLEVVLSNHSESCGNSRGYCRSILRAECSCPVGSGGRCKHIAALLLAWVETPASFQEVDDLGKRLSRYSKKELVALVRRLIEHDPGLEMLLEFSLPGDRQAGSPVDPAAVRRQAQHAFRLAGGEAAHPGQIARELEPLLKLAEQSLALGDPPGSASIYKIVAETLMEREEVVAVDESGRLADAIDLCVDGLGRCLEEIQDAAAREGLLRRLLDVYTWNAQMGGIGIGEQAVDIFRAQAAPEERALLCGWIRLALPRAGDWGQQALTRLLSDLA